MLPKTTTNTFEDQYSILSIVFFPFSNKGGKLEMFLFVNALCAKLISTLIKANHLLHTEMFDFLYI